MHADRVRQGDVEQLRAEGLSDGEILDVAMAAAARTFFSKVIDAVGAEPEERYTSDNQSLPEGLEVGRPTDDEANERPDVESEPEVPKC
jgi:hypothetical protein